MDEFVWRALALLLLALTGCGVPSQSEVQLANSVTSLVAVEVITAEAEVPPLVDVPRGWLVSELSPEGEGYRLILQRPVNDGYRQVQVCVGKNPDALTKGPTELSLVCQTEASPVVLEGEWWWVTAPGAPGAMNLDFTDDTEPLKAGILEYSEVTGW